MPDHNASTRQAQARTLPKAVHLGEQWGREELELIADPDFTAEELAEALGRTVYAVQSARQTLEGRSRARRSLPQPAFRFTFGKGWNDRL